MTNMPRVPDDDDDDGAGPTWDELIDNTGSDNVDGSEDHRLENRPDTGWWKPLLVGLLITIALTWGGLMVLGEGMDAEQAGAVNESNTSDELEAVNESDETNTSDDSEAESEPEADGEMPFGSNNDSETPSDGEQDDAEQPVENDETEDVNDTGTSDSVEQNDTQAPQTNDEQEEEQEQEELNESTNETNETENETTSVGDTGNESPELAETTVTITNDDGVPIQGARAEVPDIAVKQTDANGQATFLLPEGEQFAVYAWAEGHYDSASAVNGGGSVTIDIGEKPAGEESQTDPVGPINESQAIFPPLPGQTG